MMGKLSHRLAERVLGRVAAEDILRPGTEDMLVAKGELIDEIMADKIDEAVCKRRASALL